jgi:hypothetical protein
MIKKSTLEGAGINFEWTILNSVLGFWLWALGLLNRRQFNFGRRFFNQCSFGSLIAVRNIKDRRTNKNGEEKGDNVHADAKKERVPATNGRKSRFGFHGYYFSFFRVSARAISFF